MGGRRPGEGTPGSLASLPCLLRLLTPALCGEVPSTREGERLSLERQAGEKGHASRSLGGWHRSPRVVQLRTGREEMLAGLQTSPWEILWGLKPLSAPSSPQVGHLLTLQGSEPSQPQSSENLAALSVPMFIPQTLTLY